MRSKSGPYGRAGGNGTSSSTAVENSIIAKLPANELAAFLERAEKIGSPLRETLFELNEPFERVLFPLTGMGSLVTVLKDGTTLEAQTVGREGFMGLPLFHGIPVARCKGITQVEGDFYQLAPKDFVSLLKIAPELRLMLHRLSLIHISEPTRPY